MKDIKECTKVVLHNLKFETMEEQDSVWDKERKISVGHFNLSEVDSDLIKFVGAYREPYINGLDEEGKEAEFYRYGACVHKMDESRYVLYVYENGDILEMLGHEIPEDIIECTLLLTKIVDNGERTLFEVERILG